MTKKDIPVYSDPDSFEELAVRAKYPCTTEYMEYDPLLHRYFLTVQTLQNYGIDAENAYTSDRPQKTRQFIEEVTEDVYGVIMRLAPFNYRYHCAQIAQAHSVQFGDRYTARKQFEKALVYQAVYKLDNIDVRDVSGIDLENGNSIYYKQLRKELRHISPKTLDILHGLGVLFNGHIPGKNYINYAEVM